MVDMISCPLCGEEGFDGVGLALHKFLGFCPVFNKTRTEVTEEEGSTTE